MEKLLGYQKNDSTYFHVLETSSGGKLTREAIEKRGIKLTTYEMVKLSGLDGIYFEGLSKNAGEAKNGLLFDDGKVATMVIGFCPSADNTSRQELRDIFSHAYYESTYEPTAIELAGFQHDETITGFKYATTRGNMFFFSPDGKLEFTGSPAGTGYQIMTSEADSYEKVRKLIGLANERLSTNGVKLSNVQKEETIINGYKAYEVTMDGVHSNGEKAIFYEVGLYQQNPSSAIIFFSIDSDGGTYLEKYKATARSIKL